jgi:hypothetical protein
MTDIGHVDARHALDFGVGRPREGGVDCLGRNDAT